MALHQLAVVASLAAAYLVSSSRVGFLAAFTALCGIQLLLWAVWTVVLYPTFFSPLRRLPGPGGNMWFMGQSIKIALLPTGKPMAEWARSIPNDGLIRYLGPLNRERLLITSPKALAEVLVTRNYDFVKPSDVRFFLGRVLGTGLLLAEGDEHKLQRRNLLPAFAFRHVKDLYPVFWDKAREVVQAMTQTILQDAAERPDGDKNTAVIEVGNWASRVTLDIIGVAGLGRDFHAVENPDNGLSQTYRRIFQPNGQAALLGFLALVLPPRLVGWLPLQRNEDIREASRTIRAACAELVREKREKLARKELAGLDILSVAIESGGFTDENLVDQLMTFLAAGHETTSSAMTWAAYLLARHPDVQARLRAEVRGKLPSIAGAHGATISSLDIDRLPYLNAVCNEVLRYFSPVPLSARVTARDTTILGHPVPKGTRIVISPWAVNKLEGLWGEDALQFNPDRWMVANEDDEHDKRAAGSGGAASNYAFLTFLHGPRSCIGQSFAKAEFACLLAAWVGRFGLELHNKEEMDEDKIEIKGGVTVRPAKGMYLRATVLDGW